MCPTPDSTLADPHQISADLQRQLAECRAERDEALARETAMAEVLQVIKSSPGDRTSVFEAILEKARILCGADHGSLSLYDGDKFCGVAITTRSQELADRMRQGFLLSDFPYLALKFGRSATRKSRSSRTSPRRRSLRWRTRGS